ncbi:MAG TPA: hypothetical protein VGL53_29260 [Bryobacteraceae bacterium]|jgi:SAM-dependent methyltransferase
MISSLPATFWNTSPPPHTAFRNIYDLLKPGGVAIITVPYSIDPVGTSEHFPQLNQYVVSDLGGKPVLVNRTPSGKFEVFDQLVFHFAASPSLEMREFSESGLRDLLAELSFDSPKWYGESNDNYGIVWPERWSLPFALRKGPASFGAATIHELVRELAAAKREGSRHKSLLEHFNRRLWTRMGRAAKLL